MAIENSGPKQHRTDTDSGKKGNGSVATDHLININLNYHKIY
jgi:hypothetical protein